MPVPPIRMAVKVVITEMVKNTSQTMDRARQGSLIASKLPSHDELDTHKADLTLLHRPYKGRQQQLQPDVR